MKIRYVERRDLDSIIELCKAHTEYEKAEYQEEGKKELLAKFFFGPHSEIKCIVVEIGEEIVGYATFFKQFSTWDATYYLYMGCLFLYEKARGKGIGRQIMDFIKAYAWSVDCSMIQWQTPVFNQRAINFYQKLDAESITKERFTWKI